jgi:hypothetical protein
MPKVPAFFVHAGVKLTSIALEFTRSGPAAATISAIAQGETRFGTTQGGTPTSLLQPHQPVPGLDQARLSPTISTARPTRDAAGTAVGVYQDHPQIVAQAYPGIGG